MGELIAPQLATWAVGELAIPAEVTEAALRHLTDGFGTAIAAARASAADPAVTVALDLGGAPEATVLGTTSRISAPAAALANGTLVHALDFDDTHAGGLVHATAVVLPAALAVGEQVRATGAEFLEAAVVGYEVACRVAAAAPNGFHARGLHATMIAGVFSSAAVAARLLRLDAATATAALGIAGSQAGGLLAFLATGASTKQLHPGFASQAGILAARLAAAGASGPDTVFDGPYGVYDTLSTGPVDTSVILRGLGSPDASDWETTRIGIKPWPTCQLAHATMAAAQHALANAGVTADQIIAIDAQVHPDSATVVCAEDRDLARPVSPYAAKFSLPWSVAAMLIDGTVGVDTYAESDLARAEVTDLAARVNWQIRATDGVAADAPGDVTLTLRDGRTVTGHVDRSPGGGTAPLSDLALWTKFSSNAGPCGAPVAAVLRSLPTAPDLADLVAVAAAAVPARAEEAKA